MVTTAPNTQPIYPRNLFTWKKQLIDEIIVGKKITTETPVLLGTAGVNGCIIYNAQCKHLGVNPECTVKLFVRPLGSTDYFIENEIFMPAATTSPTELPSEPAVNFALPPILPNNASNTALHLPPECSLFVALSVAVTDGLLVTVRGGDY